MSELHVILGAGPLGLAVADRLAAEGKPARLVARGAGPAPAGVERRAADAMDPQAARSACAGATVVYLCAAPPYTRWPQDFPRLQENVLGAAAAAGAVLVAAENLYGYGVAGVLTEDLPMAATTRKGRARAAMSDRLFAAHAAGEVRATAGRAADFFGLGVRQSAFGERLWPALLRGGAVDWFGDPDAPHSVTYVPDFAAALVRLGADERAWGRAWHVPSPPPLSPRALIARAAARAGVTAPRIRRTPALVLRAVGLFQPAAGEMVEMGYLFDRPCVISDAAYREAFDGAPTDLDAALDATLAWWRGGAARG